MANQPAGARARRLGAVARGDGPDRRRGMWWLLAALLLAVIIAGVLIALLSGGSHHAKRASAKGALPAASASSSTAAAVPPAAASSTAAPAPAAGQSTTTTSNVGSGAGGLPAAGQVGGDGVPARTATGHLAPAGSIGAILFAEAGTGLDRPAHTVITTAVREVRARHSSSVTVVGFTDSIGNAKANRTLSLKRARRVVAAMRQQLGASTTHLTAEARGQTHPVAPNTTAQGRQLDRRVEIFVKS